MHRSFACLPAFALALVATTAGASSTDSVTSYGISQFGGPNECGKPSQSHTAHTLSATAFTDEFQFYSSVLLWGPWIDVYDTAAGSDYFTDPSRSASCNCSLQNDNAFAGVDHSVVSYVHTHGAHDASVAGGKGATSLVAGNSNAGNTCNVSTDKNYVFGNASGGGHLEIATFKACEAGDFTVWKQGGLKAMAPSSSHFQVFNSFHGVSSCGNFVADYVADFAADSFFDGVGENWIDEAYESNGIGKDDCPVTVVYGSTKSSRKNMFTNGGFLDRKLTNATKSGSTYVHISACSPKNGVMLPQ